jgi:leader peptidase (prepilin peptidase) / N-methyltransferase
MSGPFFDLIAFVAVPFVLGLLFGSFLNVCISRLPRHESIVHPRSHCPQCGATIRWYDNIPLLSWLLLRGRCRNCNQRIPVRYPLVELAVGLWFVKAAGVIHVHWNAFVYQHLPFSATAQGVITEKGVAILGFLLIGLLVMDWQTLILPDAFTLTGIAIGLFLICTQAIFLGPHEDQIVLSNHHIQLTSPGGVVDSGNLFFTGPESLIFGRIAAICGTALLLLLIRWLYKAIRHREGMGLGDVKLLAMIAAFLGFWPALLAFFIGIILASIYSVTLLARRQANALTRLPLGTFICIGGLTTALIGEAILTWYKSLL